MDDKDMAIISLTAIAITLTIAYFITYYFYKQPIINIQTIVIAIISAIAGIATGKEKQDKNNQDKNNTK